MGERKVGSLVQTMVICPFNMNGKKIPCLNVCVNVSGGMHVGRIRTHLGPCTCT